MTRVYAQPKTTSPPTWSITMRGGKFFSRLTRLRRRPYNWTVFRKDGNGGNL